MISILVYSMVRMAVVGRNQSAWRQCDAIDDVTAMDDRELDVVERVSGERLYMAGERCVWMPGWLPWLLLLLTMMMKYRRQYELGHFSRHAPDIHLRFRNFY